MHDRSGTPQARYWVARNRFMTEFGWTPDEADKAESERMRELKTHMKIWELQAERQDKENMRNR